LGFEGHGGNRTPTIRGIIVHQHNVELLKEAFVGFDNYSKQQEAEAQQKRILHRWKKLIQGALLQDRIQREYGQSDETQQE
jgi:xeroderma pigmentosum group C-complementing protein